MGFVEDFKKIRQRARKGLEEGAVTKNYGGDTKEAIDLLNHAVATEIVCVLRYKFHAVSAVGRERLRQEGVRAARQGRGGAPRLAGGTDQSARGKPNMNPEGLLTRASSEYVEGETLVAMIKEDLVAERVAIETGGWVFFKKFLRERRQKSMHKGKQVAQDEKK